MANEKIDWLEEAKNLKNKGETYWRPKPGQHKPVFLSNGIRTTGEFEGKEFPKVDFEIEVDVEGKKERYIWSVTKGMTKSSLYGQIAIVAKANGGNLIGVQINLVVKGVKKETSYTVLEALPFMEESKD